MSSVRRVTVQEWDAKSFRTSTQRGATMSVTIVTSLRTSVAQRRAARTNRRRLAEELASYQTPAERLELDLILGRRRSSDETAEIDTILNRQPATVLQRFGI
jgi:hypothetical protein